MNNKNYLYFIKKLNIKSWVKYWLLTADYVKYIISDVISGLSLTINNTLAKPFQKLIIKGNSTQKTTTGKNKSPFLNTTQTINEITFTPYYTNGLLDYIDVNGTATDNAVYPLGHTGIAVERDFYLSAGTYILTDNIGNYTDYFTQWTDGTTYVNTGAGTGQFTISEEKKCRVTIYVRSGKTLNHVKFKPMIRLSTADSTYEPYTGGMASPNPSYPQPILSSGDSGTITEKIVNKNLFDGVYNNLAFYDTVIGESMTFTSSSNYLGAYCKVEAGKTYSISKQGTTNRFRIAVSTTIPTNGSTGLELAKSDIASKIENITIPSGYNYLSVYLSNQSGDSSNVNLQIEYGSTATTYTAHAEQTYTIPCQQSMRKIGDVQDEFIKVDGVWKERHNIGKLILDGTENWGKITSGNYTIFNLSRPNTMAAGKEVKCNIVVYNSSYSSNDNSIYVGNSNLLLSRLILNGNYITEVTDLETYLAQKYTNGTPVYVDYQLSTPTDLPCTSEQIAILENLPHSYNEQTNIYSLDVTPAYLDVQVYVKKEV